MVNLPKPARRVSCNLNRRGFNKEGACWRGGLSNRKGDYQGRGVIKRGARQEGVNK